MARIPKLSYFNRLIADESPVALGAVLIQFVDGDPRVISFASKSLSAVERLYSQTEKEFGVSMERREILLLFIGD